MSKFLIASLKPHDIAVPPLVTIPSKLGINYFLLIFATSVKGKIVSAFVSNTTSAKASVGLILSNKCFIADLASSNLGVYY